MSLSDHLRAAGTDGDEKVESSAPVADPIMALKTRARDALLGERISWDGGEGVGAGIDADGGLRVETPGGERVLSAGEVHLGR